MKIVWTPAAQDDYWDNISFLKRKWSEKEVEAFMNKTESILHTLTSGNVSYTSATNLLNVHKIPIVKQVILFYMIKENTLYLLRFWSAFKNPDDFTI